MIKQVQTSDFPRIAEVIRASFITVAAQLNLTEQNSPRFTPFTISEERLQNHFNRGWGMYGLYEGGQIIGYAAVSKENDNSYEIHNLAVLPEHRHKGHGRRLLDFCKEKVKEAGGVKIILGIIEENSVLKDWYTENGFIHTGTKKFSFFPFTCGYMEYKMSVTHHSIKNTE